MTEKSWNIADRLESCFYLMHLLNMTSIYSVYHDPFGHPLASMCIPIKSTSQDSSSSLDALLCRVLRTLYGFSLKFISFSCNFYLQFVDPFVHFVPEVMLAKANARFVAQIFCTWRPEAKFQWKLVPAYQILAKELDDVIVHCQISFGQRGSFEWQGHWACISFCQVILQETCDSPETPRKGFAGRSVFLKQYACWLVEHFRNPMSLQKCFTFMSFWHFIATMALAAWWVLGRLAGSWKVPA